MFSKIGEFIKPFFSKGDNMPAQAPGATRRVGGDDAKGQEKHEKGGTKKSGIADDFAQDRTVFSLAAIRAGLMEGAGSISDEDLNRAVALLDRLAKQGIRGVPVSDGQGLIAALAEAESHLMRGE